jgi:hypothetical protein
VKIEQLGNPSREPWDSILQGFYAIPGRDGRELDFYYVQKPSEGKWSGWTFLKMVVGGKPNIPIRKWAIVRDVLSQISNDPARAAWLYGTNIGNCDKCNKHLTDATSRQHGRGPDCRKKYGPGYMAASAA